MKETFLRDANSNKDIAAMGFKMFFLNIQRDASINAHHVSGRHQVAIIMLSYYNVLIQTIIILRKLHISRTLYSVQVSRIQCAEIA